MKIQGHFLAMIALSLASSLQAPAAANEPANRNPPEQAKAAGVVPAVQFTIEPGHSWLPPYGVERVGRPMDAVVRFPEGVFDENVQPSKECIAGFRNGVFAPGVQPPVECTVVSYRDSKEISRRPVVLRGYFLGKPALSGRVTLADWPSEAALLVKRDGQETEAARAKVEPAPFEAEAVARPDRTINPVDLGAILVPDGWVLLAPGQRATLEVAALNRGSDLSGAEVEAWFESVPKRRVSAKLALPRGKRERAQLQLGPYPGIAEKDRLQIAICDAAGKQLWSKTIPVMYVAELSQPPRFGARETKLRYDMPIPVKGKSEGIDYAKGWDPTLNDVVVYLPNAARFVFWRGSSYAPFWAGRSNMGLCYEWAELAGNPLVGKYDCAEPLQDKELRYGRVRIVESTPARVHVRWDYQSCDQKYDVWGDSSVEDYFFYPDGFGNRVLTQTLQPDVSIETCEYLYILPAAAYPFDAMPQKAVDILWPEGKATFTFPCRHKMDGQDGEYAKLRALPREASVLHRLKLGKTEPLAAIYYSPLGCRFDLPGFGPFVDGGAEVTPMYWGDHWPLSRGYTTNNAVNGRIHETPYHLSAFHAGNPKPLRKETGPMRDALGKPHEMTRSTYAWLIGASDADDETLRHWMQSVAEPAAVEIAGGVKDAEFYIPERRAYCLAAEGSTLALNIKPNGWCMNPVFEIRNAPKKIKSATLAGQSLASGRYAWDGKTLWIEAALDQPAELRLEFADR